MTIKKIPDLRMANRGISLNYGIAKGFQGDIDHVIAQLRRGLFCGGDLSVTEVGMECGFTDTSHFVKTFKKYKGVTPKQFRLKEGKSK